MRIDRRKKAHQAWDVGFCCQQNASQSTRCCCPPESCGRGIVCRTRLGQSASVQRLLERSVPLWAAFGQFPPQRFLPRLSWGTACSFGTAERFCVLGGKDSRLPAQRTFSVHYDLSSSGVSMPANASHFPQPDSPSQPMVSLPASISTSRVNAGKRFLWIRKGSFFGSPYDIW